MSHYTMVVITDLESTEEVNDRINDYLSIFRNEEKNIDETPFDYFKDVKSSHPDYTSIKESILTKIETPVAFFVINKGITSYYEVGSLYSINELTDEEFKSHEDIYIHLFNKYKDKNLFLYDIHV